ncbi:MAG: phage portal protein [Alphaproteobacteria bacterium CG11_big_fil_rev_8_21_14_0_20_44_7]|nr:MAG: phage portal protein [Alphaproteobacteria bacterium CG11_big_fil_rev_8_21_14_0_20_44_7]
MDVDKHPLGKLIVKPNPCCGGTEFFESLYSYKLIAGNCYILALGADDEAPFELHSLRPDRVSIITGRDGMPSVYRYQIQGNKYKDYAARKILHLKNFHPLDDWYGLSPVEAAAYSIDQHNQSGEWNQALLQNGARPSGALIVKQANGDAGGYLSEDQYNRIKNQVDEQFSGYENAGRPLLLEGGLDWREMSLKPKDMDFINMKHSAARDIALAFGVPPQLLGIPGDNTYSNLAEARLALWEQTVIPLVEKLVEAMNSWLAPMFDGEIKISADLNNIPALMPRREALWDKVKDADFLSDEERRKLLGL